MSLSHRGAFSCPAISKTKVVGTHRAKLPLMKIFAYIIGAALVIGGILYGMLQLGIPPTWILVTGLIAGGIAVFSIAGKVVTKRRTETGGNGASNGGDENQVTKKETTVE
jgi:hypothetical protein